jgi:hypothetical protein
MQAVVPAQRLRRCRVARGDPLPAIARSPCDRAIQSACVALDCFAHARNDVDGPSPNANSVIARSPCDDAIQFFCNAPVALGLQEGLQASSPRTLPVGTAEHASWINRYVGAAFVHPSCAARWTGNDFPIHFCGERRGLFWPKQRLISALSRR